MSSLQIEDKQEYRLPGIDTVETFEEAKPLIDNNDYYYFILDGNFRFNKSDQPGINAPSVADYIKFNKIPGKIIIWTNSIRAMRFCQDNDVVCYCKKPKSHEHEEKMQKYGVKEYPELKTKEQIIDMIK